mgnify:CR=1 FL=1
MTGYFYPRSPRGERPSSFLASGLAGSYFYPRSPRGERRNYQTSNSITWHFYPRSPRGERPPPRRLVPIGTVFLSTLPARGATLQILGPCGILSVHFYPRSPRGERHRRRRERSAGGRISIHAPREGSDPGRALTVALGNNFYPRSPRGERPVGAPRRGPTAHISIHAPREGSDMMRGFAISTQKFLSTLPARGATSAAGM